MLGRIRQLIKEGRLLTTILRRLGLYRAPKIASGQYWEDRYAAGGNSGAGSYNKLALFKAEIINDFVKNNEVNSIIEFGSGDGAQLELAEYPKYLGIDVSHTAVKMAAEMHADNKNYSFKHIESLSEEDMKNDLSLSLDVIFHLIEQKVFEDYIEKLFSHSSRYVIIYSSNYNQTYVRGSHEHHREFLPYVLSRFPEFEMTDMIPNKYPYDGSDKENTSFADFYFFERKSPK